MSRILAHKERMQAYVRASIHLDDIRVVRLKAQIHLFLNLSDRSAVNHPVVNVKTFHHDFYPGSRDATVRRTGKPPYAYLSDEDVRESLKHGEIPEQPDEMDDEVWELVRSMTDVDPAKRIGLDRVIEKLSKYAGQSAVVLSNDASARCSVCDALVFNRSRCCAQCGHRIFIKKQVAPSVDFSMTSGSPRATTALTTSTTVPDLLEVLRAGSCDKHEDAVLLLLQACLHDSKRRQISEENGIPVLTDLVKNGGTHFIKMCAFGCLSWSSELDSTITDRELEVLQGFIRLATDEECISLVNDLRDGNAADKLKTVINCSCIAEANGRKELRAAGVVPPLVRLLEHGNDAVRIWTMDALGTLANDDESKSSIVAERAIPQLVGILRGGTEIQRGFAAYVLGQLSSSNGPNSAVVVESGAIPFLVGLLRAQASIPKTFAACSLLQTVTVIVRRLLMWEVLRV